MQQDFSAILVSISAISIKRLPTYILLGFKLAKWAVSSLTHCSNPFQVNMFISRFMIQILHNIQNVQEGKRHQIQRKGDFITLGVPIFVFFIQNGANFAQPLLWVPKTPP
jgi:hypothetical protein